jgi:hypothetical protein
MTMFLSVAITSAAEPFLTPTAILSQSSVAHAVEPVLNPPVRSREPQQSPWTDSFTIKARDSEYDLGFDRLAYPALSSKPKNLGTALPVRSQILAQRRRHLNGALLDAAMALVIL